MADNVFAYLGDDILNSTLQDFSRLINTHFPGQVQNDPVLKSSLEKFSYRADHWPEEVVRSFRNREAPCYTQEQVVKINQSFINDTDLINKLREMLSNIQIFVCLVSKLNPQLNKPSRFAKLLDKVKKCKTVNRNLKS